MICPKCHVEVARFDPEQVQVELDIYHGACHRQVQKERDESVRLSLNPGVGVYDFYARNVIRHIPHSDKRRWQ